ncbi:unnamed protein product [Coccothraustes coccothraustes]
MGLGAAEEQSRGGRGEREAAAPEPRNQQGPRNQQPRSPGTGRALGNSSRAAPAQGGPGGRLGGTGMRRCAASHRPCAFPRSLLGTGPSKRERDWHRRHPRPSKGKGREAPGHRGTAPGSQIGGLATAPACPSDGDPGMGCSVGTEPTTVLSALAKGFHCSAMPFLALRFPSLPCGVCPASKQPLPCCARGPSSAALIPAKSAPCQCAVGVAATVGDRCHGGAAAAHRAHTSTFPTKLWRLVHSLCVCYLPCDIQAQGLLIICSLFQRELLSQSDACQAALYSFQAMQFCSFVLQLHCYSFHRVPGWVGFAAPGNAGA